MSTILKTAGEGQIVRRSAAVRRLGRQIFVDLEAAGWLKHCAIKPGKIRPHASIFYDLKDIIAAEKKILRGQYPPIKTQKQS